MSGQNELIKGVNSLNKNFKELLEVLKEKESRSTSLDTFLERFSDLVKILKDEDEPHNLLFEEDVISFLDIKQFNDAKVLTRTISIYAAAKSYSYHLYKFLKDKRFTILDQKNYSYYSNRIHQEEWDDFAIGTEEVEEIPWQVCFFVEDKKLDFKFILRFMLGEDKYCFFYDKKDKKKINKLNNEFKTFFLRNNIYKNKRVEYTPRGLDFLEKTTTTFEDVVLPDFIKKEIDENILNIFNKPKLYKKHNLPLKRGIIFSGPPGCGKSLTINALTTYLADQITVICVTAKSITIPNDISNIYEFARMLAPSLVIFEDIDLLGGDRAKGEFSPFVGELLNQLDGLVPNKQIVTIASTNFPERLDEALRNRPSRFDRNLTFILPDDELRVQFLEKYLEPYKYDKKLNLKKISAMLNGLSGAQIKEVVVSAVLYAVDDRGEKQKNIILTEHDLKVGFDKSRNKFDEATRKKVGF